MPGSDEDSTKPPASLGRRLFGADIKSRIIAGIVLGAAVLALDWWGPVPFALLVLAVGMVMSWEWSRVVHGEGPGAALVVHMISTVAATLLASFGLAFLGIAVVAAGAIIVLLLQLGNKPLLSALGVAYTGLPGVSLSWIRSDEPWGFTAILFLFLIVIATDVMAFFSGRTFGGPKLAPAISPNKTWSGLIGGVTAAALTAMAFAPVTGSDMVGLAVIGALLGGIAQSGDLAESALKRRSGVKDASNLIPGHGGFMDRADGIVAAAVAAAILALYTNPYAPAAAIVLHP